MCSRRVLSLVAILLLCGSAAWGLNPYWTLQQNDPNPFCNAPGQTRINFAVDRNSNILLEVLYPDTTGARTLVNGVLMAGYHSVIWDGRDDYGAPLPVGSYPYRLAAFDPSTGAILFQATMVADISCPTPSERRTWGRIKCLCRS